MEHEFTGTRPIKAELLKISPFMLEWEIEFSSFVIDWDIEEDKNIAIFDLEDGTKSRFAFSPMFDSKKVFCWNKGYKTSLFILKNFKKSIVATLSDF